MRSTTVAGAWRAAAAGHAPEAERVGNVPAALRRAIWSADVQQSTAAVSAAFWDKMVPAHNASLMQVAHSSLRGVVLFRHQVSLCKFRAWGERAPTDQKNKYYVRNQHATCSLYNGTQNMTEHNPAPSPSGHPLLSGPPTLTDIHQIFTTQYLFLLLSP